MAMPEIECGSFQAPSMWPIKKQRPISLNATLDSWGNGRIPKKKKTKKYFYGLDSVALCTSFGAVASATSKHRATVLST